MWEEEVERYGREEFDTGARAGGQLGEAGHHEGEALC